MGLEEYLRLSVSMPRWRHSLTSLPLTSYLPVVAVVMCVCMQRSHYYVNQYICSVIIIALMHVGVMSTGRKCLRLDAQDMDEIEKIGGD